jgi:WD40 repeat protein
MRHDYDVSPVGECVAYTAYEEDVDDFRFHLAALDDERVREVWRAPTDGIHKSMWPQFDEPIVWSLDGQRLAHINWSEDEIRIWDLITGEHRYHSYCPRYPCAAWHPHWSPDGTHIYYHSGDGHWILDVATGQVKKLSEARNLSGGPGNYQWLPDSQSLVIANVPYGSFLLWLDGRGRWALGYPGGDEDYLIDDLFW